jgi:DNA-directed RNA polymerase subunit beta'
LKENVIVGHKIPAGTGMRKFDNMIVANKEELERLRNKKNKVEAILED